MAALDLDPDRRRRERREPGRRRAGGRRWAPAASTGVKLSKVGGPEAAIEIAEVLPSYLSSALDGPVGIAAAAQVAQTLRARQEAAAASPTASPPSDCSPRRSPRPSASCATATAPPARGPGLGVEIDEEALAGPPALACVSTLSLHSRRSRPLPVDPTNGNTALASAFVEELARCGLRHAVVSPGSRSTPLAVALWRQPEIEVTVIVDERSAGFFALGAAQASGDAGGDALHLGHGGGQLPPGGLRGRRVGAAADRADAPTGRRSCAGSAPARRSTRSSSTATAVRWFCEVGTHAADDDGPAPLPLGRLPGLRRGARRDPPRARPPQPALARAAGPAPVEGAVTATDPLALEGRGGRPLTAVTRLDLEPSDFLLEEVAKHIDERDRRGDRRRPPARPRAARAAGPPGRAPPASRSWPSRPRSSAAAPTTAPT